MITFTWLMISGILVLIVGAVATTNVREGVASIFNALATTVLTIYVLVVALVHFGG